MSQRKRKAPEDPVGDQTSGAECSSSTKPETTNNYVAHTSRDVGIVHPVKRSKKWKKGERFKDACTSIRTYIQKKCHGGELLGPSDSPSRPSSNSQHLFTTAGWKSVHGDVVVRYYSERFSLPAVPDKPTQTEKQQLVEQQRKSPSSDVEDSLTKFEPDMYLQLHVNGLCVVGLAPHHAILQACAGGRDKIKRVRYLHKIIVGKGQKKASKVQNGSPIAEVELERSTKKFTVCSPVDGKLFGHNHILEAKPDVLREDSRIMGYVGVLMPNGFEAVQIKNNFATSQEYMMLVANSAAATP